MKPVNAEQIVEEFGLPERPESRVIPKEKVITWMASDDLEVLGALYAYIFSDSYRDRIAPPLRLEEYFPFLLKYWKRCLFENPDSNWACTRYEAGWDVVKWFKRFWNDKAIPRDRLAAIKEMLADAYRKEDDELRRCVVNATLEHLFEDSKIANYFSDWKDDRLLKPAYSDALLWSQKGGKSPLE